MLSITDYTYDLPAERIAMHPLPVRDASKLLVYRSGNIEHTRFKSLADYLPANTTLFFNDTRVIRARLLFRKATGAEIEIFLLNPVSPSVDLALSMKAQGECTWNCSIGNLKRWKENTELTVSTDEIQLNASLINRSSGHVTFTWKPATLTFAEILERTGATPLPPYIKRTAKPVDASRYQTIYSAHEGSVAAPTAGLHFTEEVFALLKKKGIQTDFLTLHVSAGTFMPVKAEDALQHEMHSEQLIITRKNLTRLLQKNRFTVAVGTTAMRTLESIYWYGVNLINNPNAPFTILQTDPYRFSGPLPTVPQALGAVLNRLETTGNDSLTGTTSIYIYPGYTFKVCTGLITNFHLPALILLVAAFIGQDWKRIYEEALKSDYRFLSYGDSSLLIP